MTTKYILTMKHTVKQMLLLALLSLACVKPAQAMDCQLTLRLFARAKEAQAMDRRESNPKALYEDLFYAIGSVTYDSSDQKESAIEALFKIYDVNGTNKDGGTALHIALDAARLVSSKKSLPMSVAKTLLKHEANGSIKDNFGRTPSGMAIAYGYLELMPMLIKSTADLDAVAFKTLYNTIIGTNNLDEIIGTNEKMRSWIDAFKERQKKKLSV